MRPEDIENRSFDTAMRGYDKTEVRDFLRSVADATRELHERLDVAEHELGTSSGDEPAVDPATMTLAQRYDAIGERIAVLLRDAEASADEIRAAARQEADEIREAASREADETRTTAEQEASHLLSEARTAREEADAYRIDVRSAIDDEHAAFEVDIAEKRRVAEEEVENFRLGTIDEIQGLRGEAFQEIDVLRTEANAEVEELRTTAATEAEELKAQAISDGEATIAEDRDVAASARSEAEADRDAARAELADVRAQVADLLTQARTQSEFIKQEAEEIIRTKVRANLESAQQRIDVLRNTEMASRERIVRAQAELDSALQRLDAEPAPALDPESHQEVIDEAEARYVVEQPEAAELVSPDDVERELGTAAPFAGMVGDDTTDTGFDGAPDDAEASTEYDADVIDTEVIDAAVIDAEVIDVESVDAADDDAHDGDTPDAEGTDDQVIDAELVDPEALDVSDVDDAAADDVIEASLVDDLDESAADSSDDWSVGEHDVEADHGDASPIELDTDTHADTEHPFDADDADDDDLADIPSGLLEAFADDRTAHDDAVTGGADVSDAAPPFDGGAMIETATGGLGDVVAGVEGEGFDSGVDEVVDAPFDEATLDDAVTIDEIDEAPGFGEVAEVEESPDAGSAEYDTGDHDDRPVEAAADDTDDGERRGLGAFFAPTDAPATDAGSSSDLVADTGSADDVATGDAEAVDASELPPPPPVGGRSPFDAHGDVWEQVDEAVEAEVDSETVVEASSETAVEAGSEVVADGDAELGDLVTDAHEIDSVDGAPTDAFESGENVEWVEASESLEAESLEAESLEAESVESTPSLESDEPVEETVVEHPTGFDLPRRAPGEVISQVEDVSFDTPGSPLGDEGPIGGPAEEDALARLVREAMQEAVESARKND